MFSEKIISLQKKHKLTQEELADMIGMTRGGLQGALKNDEFKASTLLRIAQVFKVPVSYFYGEEENSGQQVHAVGDQNIAIAANGKRNFFSGKNVANRHANGGGEGSAINEKVNMLEQLLSEKDRVIEEKDRMIEQKEKLIEEKERLIKVLMEKR